MRKALVSCIIALIFIVAITSITSCDISELSDKVFSSDWITKTVDTLTITDNTLSGNFPNSTEIFNFSESIEVKKGSSWIVSKDIYGLDVFPTKIVSLKEGNNTFYIHFTDSDGIIYTYTANLYRNQIYSVTVNDPTMGLLIDSGESVSVEEGTEITLRATATRFEYAFIGWYYNDELLSIEEEFTTIITGNIEARFGESIEMKNFIFTSTQNSCVITDIKDKTVTHLEIPNGVTEIGNYAFSKCTNLVDITIPGSVTKIGDSAFLNCDKLENIDISDAVTLIGKSAFWGCNSLKSINIPKSLKIIEEGLFGYCNSLTDITISNDVTSIGKWAFRDCTSLTTVVIGNKVTEIIDYAFFNCKNLTNLTIGDSVTTIGLKAFSNCENLTEIKFPNSIKEIGYSSFENCSKLESITLGANIKTINAGAFKNCAKLVSIKFCGSEKDWVRVFKNGDWNDNTGAYTITYNYAED